MEFWEDIGKTVSDTANQGAKKLSQMTELTKMKYHLGTLEAKKEKFFQEIGSLVYQQYAKQTNETSKIAALCMDVNVIEKEMQEIREKIRKISNKKTCSACGSALVRQAIYCPYCGTKQTEDTESENESQTSSEQN